jgi:MFS family permease
MVVLGVIVFAITGGLTSIGPLAGGYLVEISWRTIFWVNIPVAIIALVLTAIAKPENTKHPAPLDYRGAALVCGGMGLAVLGLQQSSVWGWGNPITWICIAAGVAILAAFVLDKAGARAPVVLGCAVATAGFALWAHSLPDLSVGSQWYYIVLAGAGVGLVLSPANTDALNRVPANRYGEATGITQTVRNFGSSLGMAVLGTVLILQNKSNLESTATAVPTAYRRRPLTKSPTRSARAAAPKRPRTSAARSATGSTTSLTISRSPRRRSSTRWPG